MLEYKRDWCGEKVLSYCPKCGNKVEEEMVFCPKCGAPVKAKEGVVLERQARRSEKEEKGEKREKEEKEEKDEKHEKKEKGEYAFIGPLVGGLILIFIGAVAYLKMVYEFSSELVSALFFVIVGVAIIFGVIYGSVIARRRHPKT
ncbi:MAG: zinc ribbon domain-containing protein [Candidatus Bathyarchaeia archaeon]